ncbi:YoaK family protein [uncultured Bdellovibrio sp.]|uniref:YoaK family protein n=1 Tax=Bdellovibrio sp. HCB-162 TaxID=3394234 RepID=UPI0025EFCCD0|nr:YoaK family protein [uncultured Bdellovibrio sp.]
MAFQAGAINTGGYLSCHRFVSHVTGFGTLVGAEAASGKITPALGMMAVPGFFIGGTMLSAFLVDRRIQTGRRPLYPVVLFLILSLTLSVTIAGKLGYFGEFGAPIVAKDYLLLAALCLACGIQNGTVTSAFGAIIRTTHLTGITTDLGIGVVRILTGTHKIQPRTNEIRANWMRAGIITFFMLGSFLSAYVYLHAEYWGFLIPCGIATILFFWSLVHFFGGRTDKTS